MYEIIITHEAGKYYKKQDNETKGRINKAVQAVSASPLLGPHIKRLWGEFEGQYRFALGSIRIIYEVDNRNKLVKILTIRGRGDVYKR